MSKEFILVNRHKNPISLFTDHGTSTVLDANAALRINIEDRLDDSTPIIFISLVENEELVPLEEDSQD